jgi:hypothetical protein
MSARQCFPLSNNASTPDNALACSPNSPDQLIESFVISWIWHQALPALLTCPPLKPVFASQPFVLRSNREFSLTQRYLGNQSPPILFNHYKANTEKLIEFVAEQVQEA